MSTMFESKWIPWLLIAPLLGIVILFFYIPVFQAFVWSFYLERPFGGGSLFVGLQNFQTVLSDPQFWAATRRTVVFMAIGPTLAIVTSLMLAIAADRKLRLAAPARNVLIWPKAVAGASIGVVFLFIFNPFIGIFSPLNDIVPGLWNPGIDGADAFTMLIAGHVWGGIPFNFMILLAGLQSIPSTQIHAAAMDGAGPWRRILDIQIPLITPQIFLAVVLEYTESITSAFGLIDSMTQGGPGGATTLLVYKIYVDGFKGYDLSGAATQTALLMILVMAFVGVQFLLFERNVKYER